MSRISHRRRFILVVGIILILGGAGVAAFMIARHISQQSSTDTSSTSAPTPKPHDDTALACIEKLPTDVLIGQKVMVAVYSTTLNAQQPLVASYKLGGVILMNEVDESAIASLSTDMAISPTIAVDQEGGTVQRFKSEGILPSAESTADTMSAAQARALYEKDAKYLASLGVTTNFAPVVDVLSASSNPLPGRMYSSSPNVVSSYAGQNILAQKAAGITPVIKHFPGLGSANGNTDFGSATTAALPTLKTRDLLPYQSLASLHPDVMVSNAIVPELTNGQPAIWSPEAVALLRSYGYEDAVVYTDSLTAKAIPGTIADAAIKAWQAGVDVALIVQTKEENGELTGYINEIITRAEAALQNGELNKKEFAQSVERILARKSVDACQL